MKHKKQILVIDNLLTPKQNFEHSIQQLDLSYEIVWDENSATSEDVEVLVTVLKKVGSEYLAQFPNLNSSFPPLKKAHLSM